MERIDIWTGKAIISFWAASVLYLFGGWPLLLEALLAFVIVDYMTGLMAAGIEGKLSSRIGAIGIAKKIMIFGFVAIGHLIDQAMGNGSLLRDAVIFFYLANELLSIIENAGRIGVPVPGVLRKAVEVLKSKGDAQN